MVARQSLTWTEFPSRTVQEFVEVTLALHIAGNGKVTQTSNCLKAPVLRYLGELNAAARLLACSSEQSFFVLLELGQCYLELTQPALAHACFKEAQRYPCADHAARSIPAALSLRAVTAPFWKFYLDNYFGRSNRKATQRLTQVALSVDPYLQLAQQLCQNVECANPASKVVSSELAKLALISGDSEAARWHAMTTLDEGLCPIAEVEVTQIIAICDLIEGQPVAARERLSSTDSMDMTRIFTESSLTHRLIAKSFNLQGMWKDALHHMDHVKKLLASNNARYLAQIEAPYFQERTVDVPTLSDASEKASQLIRALCIHVDQHLAGSLTLASVAAALDVAPEILTRAAQAELGMSVRLMIEERRMIAARSALSSNRVGCYSIREVGENVGIKHPSTFARRYKYWFNELPADTRRRTA